jgi:L-ribulose-5-phosphate 3-epimerase
MRSSPCFSRLRRVWELRPKEFRFLIAPGAVLRIRPRGTIECATGSLTTEAGPVLGQKDYSGAIQLQAMHLSRRQLILSAAFASVAGRLSAVELSRMRLGVTSDEIDEDPVVASKFLREFGLHYAEVRSVRGKYNTSQPVEKIRELRAIFDENGIKTSVLGTSFFKIALPPETAAGQGVLDNQWSMLDGAMERAKVLGTDKLRVFAFTYRNDETPEKAAYPRIFELLKEASRRAKARGMRLALENVNHSYVWSSTESAMALKAIPSDNFGLTWDPNNAGETNETPFPEGYRKLDPVRIFHVHLRDFRHNAAGKVEWCPVGEGEFDNLGQIRALLKSGYKENFTLETHYRSPKGKAFASRTSLTALLKVIERV